MRQPPNYDGYDTLLFDATAGVMEVTLNRPEVLNAWNKQILTELVEFFQEVRRDGNIRVVLVTGAGRAFSVGGDIELLERTNKDANLTAEITFQLYADLARAMIDLEKPVIGALNGNLVGGGGGLAALCDVTLMSDRARWFCGGQLNIGIVPADVPYTWPMLCSMAKIKYHVFASDIISAHEAERIGLVSAVFPHDDLMDEARAYAAKLASRDPSGLGWTKRAMNLWLKSTAAIMDASMAFEAVGFLRPELPAALDKMRKRIS